MSNDSISVQHVLECISRIEEDVPHPKRSMVELSDRIGSGDRNAGIWSDLRSGTIITVAEDLADDASYDPSAGNWWINVRAAAVVFGSAGEGINPVSDVGPPATGQAEWWRSWPSSTTTRPPAITVRTRGTPKR